MIGLECKAWNASIVFVDFLVQLTMKKYLLELGEEGCQLALAFVHATSLLYRNTILFFR